MRTNLSHVSLLLLAIGLAVVALAQEKTDDKTAVAELPVEAQTLLEREPFDRVYLDERNKSLVLEVFALALPGGRVPEKPAPGEKLRLRLVSEPQHEYEIDWVHVVRVEVYADIVLAEANRLTTAKNLDAAYLYFAFLLKNYPNTRQLPTSLDNYLYVDVGELFKKQRFDEALAIVEELYGRRPNYQFAANSPGLMEILRNIVDKILARYIETENNFADARTLMQRIRTTYGDQQQEVLDKWNKALEVLASADRDEARAHVAAGRGREAHAAVRRMLNILPTLAGGQQLAAEIAQKFPTIMIGVTQPAVTIDPRRIDNWAARRTGRMAQRMLVEFAGQGTEGGQYVCPLGTFELSDDSKQLTFRLSSAAREDLPHLTGYEFTQRLLDLADPNHPDYRAAWARLVDRISVADVQTVIVDLRFPHILPEAYLQSFIEPAPHDVSGNMPGDGLYALNRRMGQELIFQRNTRYPADDAARRVQIVEQYFTDSQQAVGALKRGDVDVLDRLFPADVQRLRDDPNLAVDSYQMPTVHLLIPNPRTEHLDNRTFRRALAYGLNRNVILDQLLLGGHKLPGCRVISGPFPPGVDSNDLLAYAYDERLKPRPYEPRLAMTLTVLAEEQVSAAAQKQGRPPPERPTLVLAHSAGDVPRIACQSIVQQLKAVNIQCSLKELPPGITDDPQADYDLLYVELAMWEPLVDAGRLLAPDGIAKINSPYVNLALRRLDAAKSWAEARRRLQELHAIAHHDVVVIPLWQTVDYFARNKNLHGVGSHPIALYENLSQWQNTPAGPSK